MAVDYVMLTQRVASLEKAALAAINVRADTKPYIRHVQETFPYMVNRLDAFTLGSDSEDFDTYDVLIVMRLVLGHVTGDVYKGDNDARLLAYITQIINYFNERVLLIDDAFDEEIEDLEEARILSCTGYREFQHSGIGGSQVGCEFTLRCTFQTAIFQVYE